MFANKLLVALGCMCLFNIALSGLGFAAYPEFIKDIIQEKSIEIIEGDDRQIEYPVWAKPDLEYQHIELSYWVQEVLPYKSDKNNSAYLVYPKMGIVLPVRGLTNQDKQSIINRQGFDHFKYLQEGILHYVGYSPSQGVGNMVIAWHSAYFSDDLGRYKTAFQAVIFTNKGDIVWYFEKQSDGSYTRYEYEVTDSKKVQTTDTSILFPTKDIKQLTTYTCYPIGSSLERRYNKADLISEKKWFSLESPIVVIPEPTPVIHTVSDTTVATPPAEPVSTVTPSETITTPTQYEPIHYTAPVQEPTPVLTPIIKRVKRMIQFWPFSKRVSPKVVINNAINIATQIATRNYYKAYSLKLSTKNI